MWRSEDESRILNTYVPAGSTPHPFKWTPGISTGPLKVITVFRFQSLARAPGTNIAPRAATQNNAFVTPKSFTSFSPYFDKLVSAAWRCDVSTVSATSSHTLQTGAFSGPSADGGSTKAGPRTHYLQNTLERARRKVD